MPWAVYVAVLWLVAAAFARLHLIPYATDTAKHMLLIYGVMLVIALLASLWSRLRA